MYPAHLTVQLYILLLLFCGTFKRSCDCVPTYTRMTPSATLIEDQPAQHSQSQNHHISIKHFLIIQDFKPNYKKFQKIVKKCQNKVSQIQFLTECINSDNTVPATLKVRNKPYQTHSIANKETFKREIRKTEIHLMNLAKEELQNSLANLRVQTNTLQERIISMVPDLQQLKLRSILVDYQTKILNTFLKQKQNKFKHLQQKPTDDSNPTDEPTNITATTIRKKQNRPGIRKRKHIKKQRDKQKKQDLNVIFNYSNTQLDEATIKLLNRGLNFAIKGPAPTNSEIRTDCRMFNRRCLWKENFWDKNQDTYTPPIFREEKTSMPPGPTPKYLTGFLNTIESNICNKQNWNQDILNPARRNITEQEFTALLHLQQLQQDQQIIIKPADKGSGIVILNYDDYITSCTEHLNLQQKQPDGSSLPYYEKASEQDVKLAKREISRSLEIAKENGWISQEEFKAMNPTDCGPGYFYQLFKVHKSFPEGSIPPGRPIVSGRGSITENISKFVDHHTRSIVKTLPSYIEDTRDFLNMCEEVNSDGGIPDDAIIVTVDVTALYTNICKEDAITAMSAALSKCKDLAIPATLILQLLNLVFSCNFFQFGKDLYRQIIGTAMGSPSAVNSSTITMGMLIDPIMRQMATQIEPDTDLIRKFGRFLDDIIFIWLGSVDNLETYLTNINKIHPTIKFTHSYTCPFPCNITEQHDCFCYSSRSIPFLDTLVTIKNGKIITDLYRKPTDRMQYLLPSSCHPPHTITNIPYSLCHRLVRICSEKDTLSKRLEELKLFLLNRNYDKKLINSSIARALNLQRSEALLKVRREKKNRIPFVVSYHPALPPLSKILKDAWRFMTLNDQRLREIFEHPPMVAFRQPRSASLRARLVKTKLPSRKQRSLPGLKKCQQPRCNTCSFIQEGKKTVSSNNKKICINLQESVTCESKNVVYCISCDKAACNFIQYIGETQAKLKVRFSQHLGYVRSADYEKYPTGKHFNLPGHSMTNMKLSILEKCKIESSNYRKIREAEFINKFDTLRNGLNRKL